MTHNHHALGIEFPDFVEKIHYLKLSDAHFKKICEKYEEVDKAISRSEDRIDLLRDEEETALRKERLRLKDEIQAYLSIHQTCLQLQIMHHYYGYSHFCQLKH